MKFLLKCFFLILSLGLLIAIYYRYDIIEYIKLQELYKMEFNLQNNLYAKNESYNFVALTDDFLSKNKKQTLDIIYTIVNSGTPSFSFYCMPEYENCINDFNDILNDQIVISNINNFIHPFNSFTILKAIIEDNKITLIPQHKYSSDDIALLNNKVNEIINNNINNTMSDKEKIETIHDYIINNSRYYDDPNKEYGKAQDVLINYNGVCSAYTDAMELFLDRFNINSYRISSDNHIWNLVYLDGNWLHLDLTYDDPVVSDGSDMLLKDLFLINTKELENINNKDHIYNKEVFIEAK